ncbi:UbiA prenyltransferase family protein [Methanosarcina horonobensis]|uniref:hypothetical protein n=1 Tax=Methanosarcina horonobensis TaxID=418008 RepID=UPI000AAB4C82|nr:hypothetical protein [Methanosarcina horonobensis]
MKETLKAYIDLTRAHFLPAWPLIFCSGLVLAFANYGGFSWTLIIKAALIGLLGFEAGFVLNDYVDRNRDRLDVENTLTKYWRPFKERPILREKFLQKKGFLAVYPVSRSYFCPDIYTSLSKFSLRFCNNAVLLRH